MDARFTYEHCAGEPEQDRSISARLLPYIWSAKMVAHSDDSVRVVYHEYDATLPLAKHTVQSAKAALEKTFNIPYFVEARVNAEHCTVDRRLQPGDLLTFQKRFGLKGSDDTPLDEAMAKGLLRSYPGLLKIAREVKAKGLNGPESVDEVVRMVAEWCHAEFGPVVDSVKTTIESLAKTMQENEGGSTSALTDGPTDFGELWLDGELHELDLTPSEVRLVRALWNRKEMDTESVCEAVYGDDDIRYSGITDVKKRANNKLRKCKLKIRSRNEQYRLRAIESDGEPTIAP